MVCPHVHTSGHTKVCDIPQEMIIVLGTVGSSKIDHRYPLSVRERWSAVQCLPAILLNYGTRDGKRERRRTLGEAAVVTEFSRDDDGREDQQG